MINRPLSIAACLLLLALVLHAQTAPRGLHPGTSARREVEKTFGQPVREVSKTLVEYRSDKQSERIFAQYRPESNVLERMEVVNASPLDRSQVLRDLGLPDQPSASKTSDTGKTEEYFSGQFVVLTYAGDGVAGGVSRVGYYSQSLFEAAAPAGALPQAQQTGTPVPSAAAPGVAGQPGNSVAPSGLDAGRVVTPSRGSQSAGGEFPQNEEPHLPLSPPERPPVSQRPLPPRAPSKPPYNGPSQGPLLGPESLKKTRRSPLPPELHQLASCRARDYRASRSV